MTPTHAVLSEYADDAWHMRIVSGAEVREVERWLADVEARPRLPGSASGKPLAWLYLAIASRPGSMQALRSVGLLTDVLRTLDRSLTVQDLKSLVSIFERSGQPFQGPMAA